MSFHTDFRLQNITSVKIQFILFTFYVRYLVSYNTPQWLAKIFGLNFPLYFSHLVKTLMEPSAMSIRDGSHCLKIKALRESKK